MMDGDVGDEDGDVFVCLCLCWMLQIFVKYLAVDCDCCHDEISNFPMKYSVAGMRGGRGTSWGWGDGVPFGRE